MKRFVLILALLALFAASTSTAMAGRHHYRCRYPVYTYKVYPGYGYSYYRPYPVGVAYPMWGYTGYPPYGTGFGGGIGLGYW
jgi:hypothetical protein